MDFIVEVPEEQRKRIAKEIPDSIGQIRTSLKFSIESIDLNLDEVKNKIEGLKKLYKDLIQSMTISTFNLALPDFIAY